MNRFALLAVLAWVAWPSPPALAADCADYSADPSRLVELEPTAGRGMLTEGQKACLEASYAAAPVQTTKGKISRVLLVNAYAYDTKTWAKLVERHLREVEQSDPNIAYLYSFYLFNRPTPDYSAVIHWAEVALERRNEWTADVLVSRVDQLNRVRSLAAQRMWKRAQEQGLPEAEELRAQAKTYAREWMDFLRSVGRDTTPAESLCISAASRTACALR